MIKKEIILTNKTGLHARPAARFAKLANKFASEITIVYKGKRHNAKSVMKVMTLGIPCGESFTLEVDGQDEKRAVNELGKLISHGLE